MRPAATGRPSGWPAGQLLLAGIHLGVPSAGLALDVATPVELAVAALLDGHLLRVVSETGSKAVDRVNIHSG